MDDTSSITEPPQAAQRPRFTPIRLKTDEAWVVDAEELDQGLAIHPEAPALVLLALAMARLDRLSDHLDMLSYSRGGEVSEASQLAYFVRPIVDEAGILVREVHERMRLVRQAERQG